MKTLAASLLLLMSFVTTSCLSPTHVSTYAGVYEGDALPWLDPDSVHWARAVLSNARPGQLLDFDSNLKLALGFTDLETHQIGCTKGCDQLGGASPPDQLIYVFPREFPGIFAALGKAWDLTQKPVAEPGFTMAIDARVPPPACLPPEHPSPCSGLPFCSDQCGRKPADGGCNAC